MYSKAREQLKKSNQFRNKVGQVYEREKHYSDNPRVHYIQPLTKIIL
jgi:hypothetical protein